MQTQPHDAEAEKAIIACAMIKPLSLELAIPIVSEEDFYTTNGKEAFAAVSSLASKREQVNVITLKGEMLRKYPDTESRVTEFVESLTRDFPVVSGIESYARRVRKLALLRKVIATSQQMIDAAKGHADVEDLLVVADRLVSDASMRTTEHKVEDSMDLFGRAYNAIHGGEQLNGSVKFGMRDLDRSIGGMLPGQLIVIGGRPGMGKSSCIYNISNNVSIDQGKRVMVVSLEIMGEGVALNAVCTHARIDQSKFRRGLLPEEEHQRLLLAAAAHEKRLRINSSSSLTSADLRSIVRQEARGAGVDLLIVDYLQLLSGSSKSESRQLEVAEIARSLKGLAIELGIPVIALAQINRYAEMREDKRPRMSDLKESGEIEAAADVVILLYRDEYYNMHSEDSGVVEVIVAKNRIGRVGTIRMAFLKEIMRFEDLAPVQYQQ